MSVVVLVLCVIGLAFSVTGAVGIVRLPDFYLRLQCATMISTLGLLPLLVALVVAEGPITPYGGRALIVAFLSLVLSPAAAHAVSRAARRAGVPMWRGAVSHESLEHRAEPEE